MGLGRRGGGVSHRAGFELQCRDDSSGVWRASGGHGQSRRSAARTAEVGRNRSFVARGVLTDENGRDLLTNEDRSDLIRHVQRRLLYQIFRTGDSTVARTSDDGRFWFFFIVPRAHVGSWFLQPEHLFVIVAAIGLCYWLPRYLTRPVRKLQKAVERFGRGDLSARA